MIVFFSQEFAAVSVRNTLNVTSRKLSQETVTRDFIQTSKSIWDFVMANICQVWLLLVGFCYFWGVVFNFGILLFF